MARRSGLGRGLGALIPEDEAVEGASLREVPVDAVEPNPYQPRVHFDEETLVALAESIEELGVLQPVLVRPADRRAAGTGTDAARSAAAAAATGAATATATAAAGAAAATTAAATRAAAATTAAATAASPAATAAPRRRERGVGPPQALTAPR